MASRFTPRWTPTTMSNSRSMSADCSTRSKENSGLRRNGNRFRRRLMDLSKIDRRPLSAREFVYSYAEAAEVAGVSDETFRRYRRLYVGFRGVPTTKRAVFAFL